MRLFELTMKKIISQTSSSSEFKEILTKSKNPTQIYSKMQTLISYFDEWEQNLITREENLKQSQSKPELNQPDISNDEEFSSNEQLLNNFKQILNEKEQEIRKLKSSIEEKERIILIKNKELQELQHVKFSDISEKNQESIMPFSDKTNINRRNEHETKENHLKSKEMQLKELNKDLEIKKIEVINMWDEVLLKAEMLEKKEEKNEIRRIKLEQKQLEYEQLVHQINHEKAEFFQNQECKTEEDKEKENNLSLKEKELFEKSNDLQQKQKDFYLKTQKIHEMLKILNKNLKNSNLTALLQDELFSEIPNDKNLMMLTEQLSSFETSFNRSSMHWSNHKDDDIIEELKANNIYSGNEVKKINDIPVFNKNGEQEINLLQENSFELIKNSMSFNNNSILHENFESGTEKNQNQNNNREAKLYLPFQGKK